MVRGNEKQCKNVMYKNQHWEIKRNKVKCICLFFSLQGHISLTWMIYGFNMLLYFTEKRSALGFGSIPASFITQIEKKSSHDQLSEMLCNFAFLHKICISYNISVLLSLWIKKKTILICIFSLWAFDYCCLEDGNIIKGIPQCYCLLSGLFFMCIWTGNTFFIIG